MKRRGFFAAVAALIAAPFAVEPLIAPSREAAPEGLTVEKLCDAVAVLKAQNVPGEYFCVVHPDAYALYVAENGTDYFEGARVVPASFESFKGSTPAYQGLSRSRW